MTKPKWISFCGWLFVALIATGFGAPLLNVLMHDEILPPMGYGLCTLLAIPAFVLWALATLVYRFQLHAAQLRANTLMDAVGKDEAREYLRERAARARAGLVPPAKVGGLESTAATLGSTRPQSPLGLSETERRAG